MNVGMSTKQFKSMITVDGYPIQITPEYRKTIDDWKKRAILVEEKLASNRQQIVSASQQKSRLQSSKIGAIPARSANFEERPTSSRLSGEQAVRRALTSAAYNEEKAHALTGLMNKVTIDDLHRNADENNRDQPPSAVSQNSDAPIPSASSTDLEPYLSQSSTSSDESTAGTVRPETMSAGASDEQNQEFVISKVNRESYTLETPSSALLESRESLTTDVSKNKPQFGQLGAMVAQYLTEQQRARNQKEFAKLQSILQENGTATKVKDEGNSSELPSSKSTENSPSKRPQLIGESVTISPSVAGVKRRRAGVEKQNSSTSAAERLVAFVKGHLVRRVMQTQKVQHWIQTIRDCQRLLAPSETSPALDWRSLTDTRFREQVGSQLSAALDEFHAIMFDWPLSERLALIPRDDAPRGITPRSANVSRPVSRSKVSPAAASVASRGRSYSAASVLAPQHIGMKPQAADVTKRRRIGALTPPKIVPNNRSSYRPPVVQQRPATAAASSGTRSPGAGVIRTASGAVSPRNGQVTASSRPSTTAVNADVRTRRNPTDTSAVASHQPSSISSRRASGPTRR